MSKEAGTSNLLMIISAPSGAGKTTLSQSLLERNPGLTRAITCTTRPPRPGEEHGQDYYFMDRDEFKRRKERREFLEFADVYHELYGTLREEVIKCFDKGKDVLLVIDVQGAETIRRQAEKDPLLRGVLVTLFLMPPTEDELLNRLEQRGTESGLKLNSRLKSAAEEIRQWDQFDYLIVSSTREEDNRLAQAVYEAEKLKTQRALSPVWTERLKA